MRCAGYGIKKGSFRKYATSGIQIAHLSKIPTETTSRPFSSARRHLGSWFLEHRAPCCRIKQARRNGYRSRLNHTENATLDNGSKRELPQTLRVEQVLLPKLAEYPTGVEKQPKTAGWLEQGKDYRCPLMHRSKDRLGYASADMKHW